MDTRGKLPGIRTSRKYSIELRKLLEFFFLGRRLWLRSYSKNCRLRLLGQRHLHPPHPGIGLFGSSLSKALAHELRLRGIPFAEQVCLSVTYKDIFVGDYIADFVIDGKIILEIKAVKAIDDAHKAQAINYLAATGFELAIVLNFGESSLKQERLVRHKK